MSECISQIKKDVKKNAKKIKEELKKIKEGKTEPGIPSRVKDN